MPRLHRPKRHPQPRRPHGRRLGRVGGQAWVFSDNERLADWRRIVHLHRPDRMVLRDYDVPQRRRLAAEMARFCATRHATGLAIAGDAHLARRYGATFHCPSHLINRPQARRGTAGPDDSAAVHNVRQLIAAKRAGFGWVVISPVFATKSHIGGRPLGPVRARALAMAARRLGLSPLALGGMSARALRRLNGHQPAHASGFCGYAAIGAFEP